MFAAQMLRVRLKLCVAEEPRNGSLLASEYEECLTGVGSKEQIEPNEVPNDVAEQSGGLRGPLRLNHKVEHATLSIDNEVDTRFLSDSRLQRREH
jgi:hypothetical protein